MSVLLAVVLVLAIAAAAKYCARALLLPRLPKTVRPGWKPSRRD